MTGLSINKKIYSILSADSELEALVGNNIFPLIANEDVKFPFIVFSKTSMSPKYAKMYVAGDSVNVSVAICDTTYTKTVDIAERVRLLLEQHKDEYFSEILMTGCSEYFQDDAYIQRLEFQATILR